MRSQRPADATLLLRDSPLAARAARLRHVSPDEPGFLRRRRGANFEYLDQRGKRLTLAAHLARIAALAIPPAWQNVWICATPDGHVQATGQDARGRKQYRYHAAWRSTRDRAKFHELVPFGRALPSLRLRVARDLAQPRLNKRKVLGAVVTLIERTCIRVGNDEYAVSNGSYGLTTLLDRHAKFGPAGVQFNFRGKGGKLHSIAVADRKLARIVKRCRDIPGQRLFQYIDERGAHRAISSTDVNRYLREATGMPFTAKEFRTWQGTVHALLVLGRSGPHASQAAAKRAALQALTVVSSHLGNTPAICRKSYIHPAVFEAHFNDELKSLFTSELARARRQGPRGLSPEERAALACLERWASPVTPRLARSA